MARNWGLWAGYWLLLVALLIPQVSAWEQRDYEIFDLNDALLSVSGPGTDFYSVFNVSRTATTSEIQRAYRKASLSLHPDKNPDPSAHELYSLLTSVAAILRDQEFRGRYDGHLQRGIPRWRGTGYYYSHYKPSIVTISLLIILSTSFVQYVSAWLIYFRRKSHLLEVENSINNLTYTQVKKQLKKRGKLDSPNISRRAFKNATPLQLLQESGEIPSELTVSRPSLKNVLIVQLPVGLMRGLFNAPHILQRAGAFFKKAADDKALKEVERSEDTTESDSSGRDDFNHEGRRSRGKRKTVPARFPVNNPQTESSGAPIDNPFGNSEANQQVSDQNHAVAQEGDQISEAGEIPVKEGEWELQEIKNLVALVKKYPAGSRGRWVLIARELNRSVDDVSSKARAIATNPALKLQ
ncbi:hypothetical protein SpCBS45565_g07494 [Spizellomyces sp. 'palustris']|nr:hypothetical protein SpCBS45565_g07494 [Spizellomyces sp. 'palustris']